jgi:hypothetical protein
MGEVDIHTYIVIKETECKDVDWIHLAYNRVQWRDLKYGTESSIFITGGEFLSS